jgi:hypothetical protein
MTMRCRVLRFAPLGLLAAACGSGPSHSSALPGPAPVVATPVPATPSPTPDPSIPPADSGCGKPYPPPIGRVAVKAHLKGRTYWTMDSTPLVGPDPLYCLAIGFTDNRRYCPVRPEGHPERAACENWAVGKARDTGRPGPTWTFKDALCTGPESGCENHPDNQYLLNVYKYGVALACVQNGVCGEELAEPR